ncbi:MAG: hypothetical protein U0Q12_25020 [Vicinamibacterales bacterium]
MRISIYGALTYAMVGFGHLAAASDGPGVATLGRIQTPSVQSSSVPTGARAVDILVTDTGTDVTFVRLHQNEMPAGAVGAAINIEIPSRFIDLSQHGTREIAVASDGRQSSFDPNRIFSNGVSGVAAVLAEAVTSRLLPDAPVVALHNNRGTLLESYASGPSRACSKAVFVNPTMDPATFALVSTRQLFDAVKGLGINVVWEDRAGALDDGSLLAYAQRRRVPYVNVEAPLGASVEAQLGVVRRIVRVLLATETSASLR